MIKDTYLLIPARILYAVFQDNWLQSDKTRLDTHHGTGAGTPHHVGWNTSSKGGTAELGCWPCTSRSSPSMVLPLAPHFLPRLSSQLQTFAIKECSQWFQGVHTWLPCGPARSGITCINVGWLYFFFFGWQLFFIAADLPGSDRMLALNSTRHLSASVICEADTYKHGIVHWGWDSIDFFRSLFYPSFQTPPRMIKDYFLLMLIYVHSSVCPQLRCCFHLVEISLTQD